MKKALITGITGRDGSYLMDSNNLNRLIKKIRLVEIYNLESQGHVKVAFEVPGYTAKYYELSTVQILDDIKESRFKCKFHNDSICGLFCIKSGAEVA